MAFRILILILLCITFSSCSVIRFAGYYFSSDQQDNGSLDGSIYISKNTSYRIGTLSEQWKRVGTDKGDLLFANEFKKTTLTVNSTCEPPKTKFSLRALSESLTIGIKNKKIIERKDLEVDSEPALYTKYISVVDNQTVDIATIVMKKFRCVYDFSFSTIGTDFNSVLEQFLVFVSEFKVLEKK